MNSKQIGRIWLVILLSELQRLFGEGLAFRLKRKSSLIISQGISLLVSFLLLAGCQADVYAANPHGKTFVIAFVPVDWDGSFDVFQSTAYEYGTYFMQKSNLDAYVQVQFAVVPAALNGISPSDPNLIGKIVSLGHAYVQADRYIGVTSDTLFLNGESVGGWTNGPNSQGIVIQANGPEAAAHELGHTFGLCDEYNYGKWQTENATWGCPNPFPPLCPQDARFSCPGQPAADGSNSIMGTPGLPGPYAFNDTCYAYLQSVFAWMFSH